MHRGYNSNRTSGRSIKAPSLASKPRAFRHEAFFGLRPAQDPFHPVRPMNTVVTPVQPKPSSSSASPHTSTACLSHTAHPRSSPLPAPNELRALFPLSPGAQLQIKRTRERLRRRMEESEGPPIAIVGPCSIHCETAAWEYAERLLSLQTRLADRVQLV